MSCKHIYLVLLLVPVLLSCSDSTPPDELEYQLQFTELIAADDTNVPDSFKVLYLDDAAIITLWALFVDSSDLLYDVELPVDFMNNIYNGLVHIYNHKGMLDSSTYIFRYHLNIEPHERVHTLNIELDSTINWVSDWLNGDIQTENSEINNLVENYNLNLHKYYIFPPPRLPLVVLETEDRLNTFALAKKFEVIDGIVSAKRIVGSANVGLSAIDDGSSWDFEYFYSWGPCNIFPVECQFIHYWVVNVTPNGVVTLKESYGDEVPWPLSKIVLPGDFVLTRKMVLLK